MQVGPRLSIAVRTWNRADLLSDCLKSLAAQEATGSYPLSFEVIVVDDGSTDETPRVVRELATESDVSVRYVSRGRVGHSAARNHGVEASRGEVVLFFDDDQLAPDGYLGRLLDRLDASASAAGVGGPCRDYGGGPRTCSRCSLAAVDLPGDGLRRVERLLGGNMAIRKVVFERVGGFDPDLSGRGEENEWFHRARGLEFVHDPMLWVWHRRDRTSLRRLLGDAVRQGRTLPLSRSRTQQAARPRTVRLMRALAHAALRGCTMGLVRACWELGAALGPRDVNERPRSIDRNAA